MYLLPYLLSTVSPWLLESLALPPPSSSLILAWNPYLNTLCELLSIHSFWSFTIDFYLFCNGEVQITPCQERAEGFLRSSLALAVSEGCIMTGEWRGLMSQTVLNLKGWKSFLKCKGNNHPLGQHSRSVLESLNCSLGENWYWSCCPFGCLCSEIQDNISPCTPFSRSGILSMHPIEEHFKSRNRSVSGLLLGLLQTNLCQCCRGQFRPVYCFCASHYSGMGVTWCFWHLDHDWEEMVFVTKVVVVQ